MAKNKNPFVFLDVSTNGAPPGRMVFELFSDVVPKLAEKFRALCTGELQNKHTDGKSLHYKGTTFHHVVKGLWAQGGDFSTLDGIDGENHYDHDLKSSDKYCVLHHDRPGILSVMNTAKENSSSQFCVTFEAAPHLDGKQIVLGKLIQGHKTLEEIEGVDTYDTRPIFPVEIRNCGELDGCEISGSVPSNNESVETFKIAINPQFLLPAALQNKEAMFFRSKLYGPPKRRRVSAIRDYPLGCGTSAASMSTAGCNEAIASSVAKGFTDEKKMLIEDKSQREAVEVRGVVAMETDRSSKGLYIDKISTDDLKHVVDTKPLVADQAAAHSRSTTPDLKIDEDVSTFQDFPPGCGTGALKTNELYYDVLSGKAAAAHSPSCTPDPLRNKVDMTSVQDFPPGCGTGVMKTDGLGHVEAISSSVPEIYGNDLELAAEEEPLADDKNMVQTVKAKDKGEVYADAGHLQSQQLGDSKCFEEVHLCGGKLYGPLKRRKVSAIRDFPPGCGTYIAMIQTGRCTKDVVVNHSDHSVKLCMENKALVKAQVKDVNIEKVGISVSKEVKGGTDESKQGNKVIQINSRKQRADSLSQNDLKDNISESNKNEVKVAEFKSVLRRAEETPGGIGDDLVSKGNIDGLVVEHKSGIESLNKLASWTDSEKAKEYSRWGSDGMILKSSLREENVDEQDEGEVLSRVAGKGKFGSRASHVYAKTPSKKNMDDVEARTILRKSVDVRHEKNSKNNKRKYSKEEEEGRIEILAQEMGENIGLEAPGNKLIVQALMAAPNCPWRNGKRSSAAARDPTLSVEKVKNEKKKSDKRFYTPRLSDSREHVLFEDQQEDHLVLNEENRLSSSPAPREISVMVMPLGPPNSNHTGDSTGRDSPIRNQVRRTLRLFQVICRKLLQEEESKSRQSGPSNRIDLRAANILKEKDEWVNTGKPILGIVPGVEIGDEFHYRAELSIVGLHRPFQGGIDYTKRGNALLATSIVAGGSADELDSSDVLIYSGSGGLSGSGDKPPEDQKLERGNLALKNSIEAKEPVRVIRGSKESRNDARDGKSKIFSTFTYDGLYTVEKYWKEKVPQGYFALKYQLRRIPGQPELALKEVKKARKSSARPGVCVMDISDGKERIPICAVNILDDNRPPSFKYITKIMYPTSCFHNPPRGCGCTKGCLDSGKCACAVKNGGEIPFNYNGAIVQAKPLVYECGPLCKCPPTCHNRVSQNGIKIQLEVFKTKSMGWGVRSLSSIPSGSFICEYIGELLPDSVAEERDNDEYLFDIGHNYEDSTLWVGLPAIIPDASSNVLGEAVKDTGFTIDAAECGNIGRFINHSCSPNLYAQNVLYDHDDRRMPHIMFFAAENIPPLQELTYHYNYTIDEVHDNNGNIKKKDCHCGSHECSGRLY